MEGKKRVRLIGINSKWKVINAYKDWKEGKIDSIQVNCLNEEEAQSFKDYAKIFLIGIPFTTHWTEKKDGTT